MDYQSLQPDDANDSLPNYESITSIAEAPATSTLNLNQSLNQSLDSRSNSMSGGRQLRRPIQAIGTPPSYHYHRAHANPQEAVTGHTQLLQEHKKSHERGGGGVGNEEKERLQDDSDNDDDDDITAQDRREKLPRVKRAPPPLARTFSPWTPQGAVIFFQEKVSAGSIKGSIFNMILSTVGGGMLSLAFGVRQVGLIPGLILLVFSCWLSYFTNDLLLIASKFVPRHQLTKLTYWTFSLECSPVWGKHLANFTQVLLLVQNFGSFISYEVAFGGLLDLVWKVMIDSNTDIYAWVVISMTWVVVFPLSLLRSMSALRFTSFLGIACSLYLGCVILGEYFHLCNNPSHDPAIQTCLWRKDFHLSRDALFKFDSPWQFTKGFLICFPLFTFAYTAQQYMLPIYIELQRQSRRRMLKVLRRSSYIILFIYICAAGFGYLTFLDGVCGNILLNDYHKDYAAVIAAVTISISMILAQPITTYAWRMNYAEILYDVKQLPRYKHIVVSTVFTFVTMALSLMLTDIEVVFGLLGATTFPAIGFVLPAVFFVCLVPKDRFPYRRRFAIFQAIAVSIGSLASLGYQIYTMIYPTSDNDCDYKQAIETPNLF